MWGIVLRSFARLISKQGREEITATAMLKSLVGAQGRMPELDMLRGLAVSLVFGFHALGYAYGHQSLPWNGLHCSLDVPASFAFLLPFQLGGSGRRKPSCGRAFGVRVSSLGHK